MAKIFNLLTLSSERKAAMMNGGVRVFDFRGASVSRLDECSRGFDGDALRVLASRFVVLEYNVEDGRLYPAPEQFTDSERATIASGSFNYEAVTRRYAWMYGNELFSYCAMCLDCGKVFQAATRAAAHDCREVCCACCGEVLTTDNEKRAGRCSSCQAGMIGRKFRYHGRPNRHTPKFERPDEREAHLHGGAEIEIDGGLHPCGGFTDDDTAELSRIINADIWSPLMEFEDDCTIRNGVECITAPMTFEGLWKRRDALNAFYRRAMELGGNFEKVNGLHVHIDRAFFGADEEAQGKAAVLIDFMVYKFFDFFKAISRREAGEFYYARKKGSVTGLYTAAANVRDVDHYYAVNGGNSATIEFRFFGGHISTGDEFLAVFDIVQAVARWAKNTGFAAADKATPCDVVKYLKRVHNTRKFVAEAIDERPITAEGEAMRTAFLAKCDERIERNNAKKEEF